MVKICHVTCVHPAFDVRIFEKECVSLSKAGYETHLIQQGDSGLFDGVVVHGLGDIVGGRLKRMILFSRKAYKISLSIDADIYHFHDPIFLPYGLKLKNQGKKVIFDSHENTAELILEKEYIPSFLRPIISSGYKKYEKTVCNKLDALVYVSAVWEPTAKTLNKRIALVSNYPLLNNISKRKRVKSQIVFAGTVTERWCHHRVIEAISCLDDIRYVICGRISDSYYEKLKNTRGWDKVEYRGQVSHDEVYDLLAESYIGVVILEPGHNTDWKKGTLGCIKLFEVMMMGLPIICSDFLLWEELVDTYKCGICVDPCDISQIRNAIEYLIDNPTEAERMGNNGRKAVEECYNWNNEEVKLLSLYRELLDHEVVYDYQSK